MRADAERKVQGELLAKNFDSLKDAKATISAKANEQGHLFQGIHVDEIVAALKESASIDIDPSMIELKEPIKATGDHEIAVVVEDKKGSFTLEVNPG